MEKNNNATIHMSSILRTWLDICHARNYTMTTKQELAVYIGALGEAYVQIEGMQEKEKQQLFIQEILKETSIFEDIPHGQNIEFIEMCIQAGLYKMELLASVAEVYQQDSIPKEQKEARICREYIFQNQDNLYELVNIMGLSFVLGDTIENTAEKITLYEEQLEDVYDCWTDEDEEEE